MKNNPPPIRHYHHRWKCVGGSRRQLEPSAGCCQRNGADTLVDFTQKPEIRKIRVIKKFSIIQGIVLHLIPRQIFWLSLSFNMEKSKLWYSFDTARKDKKCSHSVTTSICSSWSTLCDSCVACSKKMFEPGLLNFSNIHERQINIMIAGTLLYAKKNQYFVFQHIKYK